MSSISASSSVNNTSLLLSIPPNINPSGPVTISRTVSRRIEELMEYISSRINNGTFILPPHYQNLADNEENVSLIDPTDFGVNPADFNLNPAIFTVNLSNAIVVEDDAGVVENLPIAEGQSKDQEKTLSDQK